MEVSRPSRTDALLGLAVTCLVAAAVAADAGPPARAALAYAFAAAFGAAVLLSHRWPVAVLVATAAGLVVYYSLDLPPTGLAAPAAGALYAAARRGRAVWAVAVAAVLLLLSVVARLAEGDDARIVLGLDLGSEAVLMLAVVALGDAVRSRRSLRAEMERQAAAAAEERHREAARQVEAERVRIARELHDVLGHTMSVITLQSAVAQEALAEGDTTEAGAALGHIRSAGGSAMAELRATLGTLRRDSVEREPPPGIDRLAALADGVTRSGLPVRLRVSGAVDEVPAVVGATAYRVVQEALTNALRHAGATGVDVAVDVHGARVSVEVVDDGRGAAGPVLADGAGRGLRGMSERVALLGGTVQAGGRAGEGFRVRAELPLSGVPA